MADEQRASNTRLAGGPPQLSVQLKASEPSVRRATIPVGKLARTAAFVGEAATAPVDVVDDLVYAAPEEKVHEIPVQEVVDVDILSREAAGEFPTFSRSSLHRVRMSSMFPRNERLKR